MPAASDAKGEASISNTPEFRDNIDDTTFEQILEMDDEDDDREFSRNIVWDFFDQASSTFEKMAENLEAEQLEELSALGHFLKGSSATLGIKKLKNSCEKIQNLGAQKDETGLKSEAREVCLSLISTIIHQAKEECIVAERILKNFYGESTA